MHERSIAAVVVSSRSAWVGLCACLLAHLAGGVAPARAADPVSQPSATFTPLPPPPPEPTPGPSPSDPPLLTMTPAAQAHYDRGLDLYRQQRYPAAAAELRRGFDLEPRREFLFAEAQAWRLAGDCERALPLYRQFMASQPPAVQIEAAHLGIDRCGTRRGPSGDARMLSPPTPPPQRSAPSAWWRGERGWWTAAMGAGTIALGVGVVYVVASNRTRDEALSSRTTSYARFDELWETAQQRRTVGLTALVGGALLVAAGGARLLLLHHRAPGQSHDDGDGDLHRNVDGGAARPRPPLAPAASVAPTAALSVELGDAGPLLTWQGAF